MAQPWSAVESNPQYQALTPDKQKAAKQQYFDTVVAPKVPKESLPAAQSQFFGSNDNASPAEAMAKATSPSGGDLARLQGLTFGFGDELTAAESAGLTGVANLADRAFGGKPKYSAGEAYDAVLNQTRANETSYAAEHPMASFANELLGGAVSGGKAGASLISEGKTIASRLGRSALTGAGFAALGGAGSGQGEDFVSGSYNRLKGALEASPLGAAIGLVPGAAAELSGPAKRAMGYAGRAFRSVFQSLSGKTPEEAIKSMKPEELARYQEAAIGYVKNLITGSGKKIEDLTKDPAHLQGKPVTSAEAIGPAGETQLSSIGRRAGTTGDAAESFFRVRGEERGPRLQENLAKAASLDVEHTQGHMEKLAEDLREKNDPLYKKAYAEPAPKDNKVLNDLLKRDNMKAAVAWAKKLMRNKGLDAEAMFKNPTMETWDYIKRGLQDTIGRAHKNAIGKMVTDNMSRADLGTLKELREELFKVSPAYKEAVEHGGEPLQLEEAYNNAPKLMDSRTTERGFHAQVDKMTPAQIEATKSGWVNDIYNKLQKEKLQPKDLKTPEFLGKARRLLGETQARKFIGEIQQELRLKGAEQRIPPKTQSATMGLTDAAGDMNNKGDEMLHTFIGTLSRRGKSVATIQALNDLWYRAFHAAKTPEQEVLRNEVGKLLLLKPDQLRAKLEDNKTPLSPKAKEWGQMILHLSGPTAAAVTEGNDQ